MSLNEKRPQMGAWKVSKTWWMALLLVVFVAACGRERGTLAPTLTAISPNSGVQGQTVGVTLTGTNFATGATVGVGGALITVTNTTVVSSTRITATFAIAANATLGAVNIRVTSSGITTNAVTFSITSGLAVISTSPADGAVDVTVNQPLTATFSETLNCATVTASTFTVAGPGGTPVTGAVSCSGTIATFTPAGVLSSNTLYTATLTTGITDAEGDPLAGNFVWSFTTAIPPAVISTSPTAGATGVPISQPPLSATFSQAINCATVTLSTFTVTGPGATPVAGTIACSGSTAVFTASSNFAINTFYTATVTTGVTSVTGATLAANYVWSFKTGAAPIIIPTVISTYPANNATGVPISRKMTAAFNGAMDPATITAATFTLRGPGAVAVSGAVSYVATGSIATFAPAAPLAPLTVYVATITTGAKNLTGTPLVSNYSWTFTTGTAPDTTKPTITSTIPLNGATAVAINQAVTVTFSEPMDPATLNSTTFTLSGPGGTPVAGTVTYAAIAKTATFTPNASLDPNEIYTAAVTTGATDLAGNPLEAGLAPNPWTFTTALPPDTTAPTIISTNPVDAAGNVAINATVNATFSEAMDPSTLTTATFQLEGPGAVAILGTVSYDPIHLIATFTPTSDLAANTTYTATITAGATDLAGNPLGAGVAPNPWTFTTAAAVLPAVDLGTASTFGTFGGGAGMTNQGILTVINGDISTTGASTLVTGFHDNSVAGTPPPCSYTETPLNKGTVNGGIYTAPPPPTVGCPLEGTSVTAAIATQAAADALAAYNATSATKMPPTVAAQASELGGLTLPPGVYQSAPGTFAITNGNLTLDARGNPNAYWVFQMATSLTVGIAGPTGARSVILINGAQAKNVFWHVGSAATINAAGGGTMVGTILAPAAITFSTAGNVALTVLNGRALGLTASVTMVNTVINVPAP